MWSDNNGNPPSNLKLLEYWWLTIASLDRALVGTGFVGQGHHGRKPCILAAMIPENATSAERAYAIQISLAVELQHIGVQGALCAYDMGRVQARHLGGVYG